MKRRERRAPLRASAVLVLLLIAFATTGCGGFVARRIAQSPNTYPRWFAPPPRVQLGFDPSLLTNFPARFVEVGPPSARLRYRIVEPADYRLGFSSTNWLAHGHPHSLFRFSTTVPGTSNAWSAAPRGTVVLLHGYGDGEFAMTPWALRLAEEGWRCVLVDLRGHGKSTGRRIYFGVQEVRDLSQLLDKLTSEGKVSSPLAVLGHSYGGALALRWKAVEPRLASVVALAPYAVFSNVVLNIRREYSAWVPAGLVKAGLRKLPSVLKTEPTELDTTTVLARNPMQALFVAGGEDRVAPAADVSSLHEIATPGSELILVPNATHEAVTYYFNELVPPVLRWLESGGQSLGPRSQNSAGAMP